jgi:formate dehydrogenase maturation protein FdhE
MNQFYNRRIERLERLSQSSVNGLRIDANFVKRLEAALAADPEKPKQTQESIEREILQKEAELAELQTNPRASEWELRIVRAYLGVLRYDAARLASGSASA